MPCHLEHGWAPQAHPLTTDLEVNKPMMLVFSKRRQKTWRAQSNKPVYIMGAPFIHYRRMHKITKSPVAKGTIVFPCHSTADIETSYDVEKYCQELKALPKKFHPIAVCLFWPDFIDKRADVYRKSGFEVVSAGPRFRKGLKFVKNYYKILSRHQYATSNEIGSFTFYAIDLKIPFFLTGEIPLITNVKLLNRDMGATSKIDQEYYGRQAIKMFSTGPTTKITADQEKFVIDEMGLKDCLSREQMHKLFWEYFKKDKRRYTGTLVYWAISFLLATGLLRPTALAINGFRKIFNQKRRTK